jgi:hypothetical protein
MKRRADIQNDSSTSSDVGRKGILLVLRSCRETSTKQRTMANAVPLGIVPPVGPPPLVVVPQLPYAADPGSLTGWVLETTATETSGSISKSLGRGFARLVDNVPLDGDPGHEEAMKEMADEIVNSDSLTTYLTATNFGQDAVKITVLHSIARYSAGFGGSNALHGHTLGLLGEMREDQLPMLVKFDKDPSEDLIHGLTLEEVTVPSDVLVDGYFATDGNVLDATG